MAQKIRIKISSYKTLFFLMAAPLSADTQAHQGISKMQTTQELEQTSSEWLSYAKTRPAATFTAKDQLGRSVIIEWKKSDILSKDLADFKKSISELACKVLAPIEVQFLKAYPQAVSQEMFLKPCTHLLQNDPVDWEMVEKTIQSTIRQFYLTDLSSFGTAVIKPLLDDVYFLVTIKEKESERLLGFSMLAVTPNLPFGDVKLINIAHLPEEKENGLDQLLLSSIFHTIPEVKRIFLFTRPTNEKIIETYLTWGFTKDANPVLDPNHKVNLEYLVLLEYKVNVSNILQNTAKGLDIFR